nr:MAG TPA: hypothetical protein [Caudoviricetes sp.]
MAAVITLYYNISKLICQISFYANLFALRAMLSHFRS